MKFKAMIIFLALLSILIADETTENIQQAQKEVQNNEQVSTDT